MQNKSNLILMASLSVSLFSTPAWSCPKVAKIYHTDIINEVMIWRKSTNQSSWASKKNRELCTGDIVIAPNRLIPPLKIRYYTEIPKMTQLKKGETHRVEALLKPCGTWCTAWNDIMRLRSKLTSQIAENLGKGIGGSRGTDDEDKPLSKIIMPLDTGDKPFHLFAHDDAIPLFWQGEQSPYQLEVKDAKNQVFINTQLKNKTFSLTLPQTDPEQTYTLKISSAGSVPYQNQLIFTVPPFSLDSKADQLLMLIKLLNDPKKNWRLEIWRRLAAMPDDQSLESFRAHLRRSPKQSFVRSLI